MKSLLLFLFTCFIFSVAFAQSEDKTIRNRTFKVYLNFRYDQKRELDNNVYCFNQGQNTWSSYCI